MLGTLRKDKHEGKLHQLWTSTLAEAGLTIVDAAAGLADVLAVKDVAEVVNVKKASLLAAKVRSSKAYTHYDAEHDMMQGMIVAHSTFGYEGK